jgi:flagellar biosynthesis protein FlhG
MTAKARIPSQEAKKEVRIIAVASGKGGVGKSFLAVNLAVEFGAQNRHVILMDADVGLGSTYHLMGAHPVFSILDMLDGRSDMEQTLCTPPLRGMNGNVKLLAGGIGIDTFVDITAEKKNRLSRELSRMEGETDVILLDIGAGINKNVMNFLSLADHVLIVTNPDVTSTLDAYALLKIMKNTRNITENISIVVNRADRELGSEIFSKLNKASKQFLKEELKYLGSIGENRALVYQSTQKGLPLYYLSPQSEIRKDLYRVSLKLGVQKEMHLNSKRSLLQRFTEWFGGGEKMEPMRLGQCMT